jgi:hypothetical protein
MNENGSQWQRYNPKPKKLDSPNRQVASEREQGSAPASLKTGPKMGELEDVKDCLYRVASLPSAIDVARTSTDGRNLRRNAQYRERT